ncbi:PREDICTED: SMC5-SMC6 complex localization factor protein 2 isoform X2 [Hipposideros armiger]|uniref:SMC5-SMC6 complex localization factor protein 2 isoform X2 n=1 Tax=Hipposideros armiger TaxID=186990 RepID=A0A8B7QSV5_HIPAR|nr:PREDICTED: SMC5-SMC6 complex localization factor protein 2 isoform X2 [Hipposideros armiger]
MTRRCMLARPGFPSSPAPASSPPRCHLRPGNTAPAAAGKRTESPGDRKQSIIDFFKSASKQDKRMLDSPQKSNIKYGGSSLSTTGTEQFERKLSSPKKPKPKRVPSEKSPIIEALMRGVKEHPKDPGVHESSRPYVSLTSCPKTVTRVCFPPPYHLSKEVKTLKKKHRSPERRKSPFIHGNSREKNDRDRGKTNADSKKEATVTEADISKNTSRSLGSRSSLPRHHPGESPLGPKFQLSLASYCRERELKKLRMEQRTNSENSFSEASNLSLKSSSIGRNCQLKQEQSKQNDVTPGKSNLSNLENGHLSRKRSSSDSWEPASAGSKQNKFPDKRKRNSMDSDLKSTRESIMPKAKESFLEKRPDGPHQREKFIKHIALKTPGGVLRLEDISKEPNEEADRSSASLAPSNSGHHSSRNSDQMRVASTKETKMQKPHLSLPQEKSAVKKASNLQKSKTASSGATKETKPLPLLPHVPNAGSSRVPLNAKNCTLPVPKKDKERSSSKECSGHSTESSTHKEHKAKTNKADDSNVSSGKISGGSLHSEYGTPTKSPPAALEVVPCIPSPTAPSDKAPSDKESSGNFNAGSNALKRKLRGDFDSDEESLGYNLDSDEEEETFKSLEEIMALNFNQTPASTGKPPALSKGLKSQSSDYTEHVHSGTYTNTLERLVKEMEDTQRLDELQKQLQEDIRQGRGIKSPIRIGDQDSTDDEGDLFEEHREFLKRFSITIDAIPDHHPGEEIFNFFNSGKIFNQYTLDLRDSGFIGQSAVEKLILKSGKTDQIFLTTQGFLTSAYHYVQCPVPVLKWLFRMMSVHTDCIVSMQILSTLMEITIRNDTFSDSPLWPWIPSLSDIAAVFFNMGIGFRFLFPLENLQPDFNEDNLISSETQMTLDREGSEDLCSKPIFSTFPETNILNVVKFLGLCTSIHPEGYTDREIVLLILMLFKISLEKQLKQIPLVDFQSLLINLMKNIRDWNTKVSELCLAINELSSHPHNLLWLVQLVPNWTSRGRQLRQCLSLVIISKLLDDKHEDIPNANNLKVSVLHRYLVQMKPSDLLKKMVLKKRAEQPNGTIDDSLHLELEKQAYYLTYILLHLVGEVSCSHSFSSRQRKHFVHLCGALEKHVKCDIREDARLFYRTKVKDLVARLHGKWQEIIQNCRPIQGQLHDFWVPDS